MILVPIYEDWEALALLLVAIDVQVAKLPVPARVFVVDDGSPTPPPASLTSEPLRHIASVDILSLRRNLGHQRALAVGLCYLEGHVPCQAVVVMDGDGEDAPSDVPRLYEEYLRAGRSQAVFAERLRRSEGPVFAAFYHTYRFVHLMLTGIKVRIGNFSILPSLLLHRLVVVSELWNHYAASVLKARLPITTMPTARAHRLAGQSKMNFVSLVTHGLSAVSVFSERVGVRLMATVSVAVILALGALGLVVFVRLATTLAIPGWATYTAAIILVLLSQFFVMLLVFVFVVLGNRNAMAFVPTREYAAFVTGVRRFVSRA